jgi:hypothetical protein
MPTRTGRADLKWLGLAAVLAGLAAAGVAHAESLSSAALVEALRHGGFVLLMRHASSPGAPPAAGNAEPDNTKLERQLDDTGRKTARAMGAAIKALHIPIGEVWSSPTYRALETARLAALPTPRTAAELGDHGQSMQAMAEGQSAWLRREVAEQPRAGTDTVIVTQFPNIIGVYGMDVVGLADGDTLVLHPDGKGAAEIVGWVKIEEWPELAAQR